MPRGRKATSANPDPVDIHVGGRIRQRRTLLGMSQEKLAEALDITFQQVQKYENGSNRVSASRLWHIAQTLGVEPAIFFSGFVAAGKALGVAEEQTALAGKPDDLLNRRETLELVRAYYAIDDQAVRRKMLDMLKTLGKASEA